MKTSSLLIALTASAALCGVAQADEGEQEVRVRVVEKVRCPVVEVHGDDAFGMKVQKSGFLGVEITSLTPELRSHFGVSEDEGVMVGKIVEDSAAFRAGLEVGDIVTRVDGRTIKGAWDLTSAIRKSGGGETVTVEYWRDGAVNQSSVVLDERETCTFDMSGVASSLEDLQEVLPGLHMRGLEISEDAMEEVMESLRAIDWEEHLQKIEDIHIENLDERMEQLHIRMEQLGERLEHEGGRLGHKVERIHVEKLRALEEKQRARVEHEVKVRGELGRARIEARRQATEAAVEGAKARREATRIEAEARIEAEEVIREAEHETARAAAEAEGGGVI